MRSHRALFAVVAIVSFGGCNFQFGTSTLNKDSIEKGILDGAKKQGVDAKSVSCPDNIVAKKDATFTCTLTLANGSKKDVKATQTDDSGNYRWEMAKN
jgi:hypothetical protein